jgi:hypothetical protein
MKRFLAAALVLFLAMPAGAQTIIDANNPPEDSTVAASGETMDGSQDPAADGRLIRPTVHRITSLQKCIDQLPPEEAAEVRLNPIRPYQECMSRLSSLAADRKKKKADDAKAEPIAENARNYSRIQESPTAGENGDEPGFWTAGKPKPAAPYPVAGEEAPDGLMYDGEEKKPARTFGGKGWMPSITPDNSRATFNN